MASYSPGVSIPHSSTSSQSNQIQTPEGITITLTHGEIANEKVIQLPVDL